MARRNRIDQLDTVEDADDTLRQNDAEQGHAVAANLTLRTMPEGEQGTLAINLAVATKIVARNPFGSEHPGSV
jgi:hypothetical protein